MPARKDLLRVRNAVLRENLLGAANAACGHRCSPARGLPQGTDERINSAPHAALCPRAQGGIRVAFRTDQQRTACRPVPVGSGRYSGRVPASRKNVQGRANAACRQRSPTDRTSFRRNVRTLGEKGEASERFHRAACRPVPAGSGRYSGQFLPTEHSGPKDGVRNPRGSAERLRGAAVSSQKTTASRDGGLAQNPVQRGRFAEGACNRTPEHDARTAEHDGSTNPHGRGRCPQKDGFCRNNGT